MAVDSRLLIEERVRGADDSGRHRVRQYVPLRGLPAYASRAELIKALFDYVSEEEGLPPSIRQVWPPPRPSPRSVSGPAPGPATTPRILAAEWVR